MHTIIERVRSGHSWGVPGFRLMSAAIIALVPFMPVAAQEAAPFASFTPEQVKHGEWVFNNQCAVCHGETMFDIFRSYDTAERFYLFISGSMPRDMPGWLSEQEYIDIVAYLMDSVGFTAGDQALTPDREVLAKIIPSEGAQD